MPTETAENRSVVSVTQASKMLAVSDESVKRYLMSGKLKGFKLPGGAYRVFTDSIKALMDKGIE